MLLLILSLLLLSDSEVLAMSRSKILVVLKMYDPIGEEILRQCADIITTDDPTEENLTELARDVDAIVVRAPC